MTYRASLFLILLFSLPYPDLSQVPAPSRSAFSECLSRNGIVYGPFRDGQSPDAGIYPSDAQIEEDLAFLSQVTKRIRIYGTRGSFLAVTRLAPQFGLTVMQGIHLGPDFADNEIELATGIALAKAGLVDTLIVGNEVFTQGLLTKEELLSYLRRVRREVPGFVQVSTGETWDKWIANPDLALDVDFVVAHFYPFWENLSIEGAAAAALERYDILQRTLNTASPLRDLKIVIGESGWPSAGYPIQPAAIPGPHNQRLFTQELLAAACARSIPVFLFSLFDEEYKWSEGLGQVALPQDRTLSGNYVGSSWGLFKSNGKLKTQFDTLVEQPHVATRSHRDIVLDGRLSAFYDMGVDSSGQRRNWLSSTDSALKMAYPSGQDWGAVFVTVGVPTDPPRPWKDFSEFATLAVELRGELGGEAVDIGIKDNEAPDNGSERKTRLILSPDWQHYDIPLSMFGSSRMVIPDHLRRLYVPIEFVFEGPQAETIYVRNVKYK